MKMGKVKKMGKVMKMGKVKGAQWFAVAAAGLAAHAAVAQSPGRSTQLEEVVVTAQKREESLQDTPISLAAFSGDQLEQFGIVNLGDITARTPNVDITPFPNSRSSLVIFMRGVGNNDSQTTQDPAVGVYFDGVYVGRSIGLTKDVADLERVEVLRGPQGTLYGRNTTGGAINMIGAKPAGEFALKQVLSTGNRGYRKALIQLDTPTYNNISAKISYTESDKSHWVDNVNSNNDFVEEDRKAGRFVLRWDISETFSADYAYDLSEIVGPQPYYQVLRINEDRVVTPQYLANAIASGVSQDTITNLQNDLVVGTLFTPQFRERASESRLGQGAWDVPVEDSVTDVSGHSLTLTWDLPIGTLKSISAYRELSEDVIMDYGAGVEWFDVMVNIEQDQLSQELQLVGDIGDSFNYVSGLYYFKEHGFEREVDTVAGAVAENREISSTNEAWAVYGQLTWNPEFLRALSLTLGARYTEDDRCAKKFSINFTNSPNNTQDACDDWSNFTPSLTAAYDINDNISTYAKVVTGYKSGGFNVRSTEAGFQPAFDEEEMVSYELGIKSTLMENRLRLNAAVFRSEYSDMQIQQILDNTAVFLTDVFNAGKAEIEGFEVDLTAVLSEGLTLTLGYGYTNADFVEVIDNNPNSATFQQDISANYIMPYAPQNTYNVVLEYQFADFGIGVLRGTLDYNWRDERFGTASNDDIEGFFLDDYGLLGARLSWSEIDLAGTTMTLAAWGKNLANEEYIVHSISQAYFHSGYFGELASYGLDLTIEF